MELNRRLQARESVTPARWMVDNLEIGSDCSGTGSAEKAAQHLTEKCLFLPDKVNACFLCDVAEGPRKLLAASYPATPLLADVLDRKYAKNAIVSACVDGRIFRYDQQLHVYPGLVKKQINNHIIESHIPHVPANIF